MSDFTVEQLAAKSGMSVRNIRNHQSRGLLPPPEVRARVGYYGPGHLARLRLIQEMQDEGFKLSAIKRLIDEYGEGADRFVDLRQAVTAPLAEEEPEVFERAELAERLGTDGDEQRLLAKTVDLGILVPLGGEHYEAPSPALLRVAEQAVALGIPLEAALATLTKVRRNARSSARAFVELFLAELWEPFDRAGRPEQGWGEIAASIEALRPLAAEATGTIFRTILAAEIERAFAEVLERRGHS